MRIGLGISVPNRQKLNGLTAALRYSYPTNNGLSVSSTGLSTVIGSDGTTQWGPHNLLAESGNLSDSAWIKSGSGTGLVPSITPGQVDPTGGTSASLISLDSGAGVSGSDWSWLYQNYVPTANTSYLGAVWVKAASPADIGKTLILSAVSNTVVTLTGAWQQVQNLFTTSSTTTVSLGVRCRVADGVSSSASFYFWRPQFENVTGTNRTTPSTYIDTTVPNRLSYSNDFTNAAWTKLNVTPYEKLAVTANGTPMTLLVENTTTGSHYVLNNAIAGAGFAQLQFRVKPAGRTRVGLRSESPKAQIGTVFDLVGNGSVVSGPGSITLDPSDGTYLCCANANGVGNGVSGYHLIDLYNSSNSAIYAGDGVSGVYVCNALLAPAAQNAAAIPYTYNAGTAPSIGAFYGARIDYDPVTLALKGQLVEAASTNLLLNSAVPATQSITVSNGTYTLSMFGTGTCTLTGVASGTLTGTAANARSQLTFIATAGVVLLTFSGSNTKGQVELGPMTSYIPTTGATVTRSADVCTVGADVLYQALPWLMDLNLLTNSDTPVTQNVTTSAQQYTVQMMGTGTCTLSGTATGTLTGTGANNIVTLTFAATAGTLTLTFSGSNTNAKLNPGPVAQTYYPQSKKQATISIEGDLSYGATTGTTALLSLTSPGGDIAQIFKGDSSNSIYGYANPNGNSPGSITSNTAFKAAFGISPPSAGIVLNGSAEAAIASVSPIPVGTNQILVGTNAAGNAASSMRLKSLRVFSANLPSADKKILTS